MPDPILEEEIFTAGNLDRDCSTIGCLLYDYGEKIILSVLEDGEYAIAAGNYLWMLDSLTRTSSRKNTGAGLTISTLRITP